MGIVVSKKNTLQQINGIFSDTTLSKHYLYPGIYINEILWISQISGIYTFLIMKLHMIIYPVQLLLKFIHDFHTSILTSNALKCDINIPFSIINCYWLSMEYIINWGHIYWAEKRFLKIYVSCVFLFKAIVILFLSRHHLPTKTWAQYQLPTNTWTQYQLPTNIWAQYHLPTNTWVQYHLPTKTWAQYHLLPNNWFSHHHLPSNQIQWMSR